MKNIFCYVFVGIIQGLTEFLPISSSGHIVLFGWIMNLDNLMLLSIVAHIGTLFAVLFCYRKTIKELVVKPINKTNLNLIIATIPCVAIVLLFNKFLEKSFSIRTIIWGFLFSAVMLVLADFFSSGKKDINKKNSFIMGLSQGVALLPGISRSGATLVTGLLCGVEKKQALDFSFLMSIPVITASAVWEIIKIVKTGMSVNWLAVFVVMITSFVFGILSIKLMLKLVKNNKLYYFSIYLLVLSVILAFAV